LRTLATPTTETIRTTLSSLVDRDARVKEAEAFAPDDEPIGLACYRYDDGSVAAVAICDLAFVARFGACLSLVPAAAADEMLSSGELTEMAQDNTREVFNVLAVTLIETDSTHFRLGEVSFGSEAPDADVKAAIDGSGNSVSMQIELDGYGETRLAIWIA